MGMLNLFTRESGSSGGVMSWAPWQDQQRGARAMPSATPDAVQAAGVDLGHVVVAHGAVDVLELFVVVPVETLQVRVAVDALDILPPVDRAAVLVDIHEQGDDPAALVLGQVLVLVAVQAIVRRLGDGRSGAGQEGQEQSRSEEMMETVPA